MFFFVDESGHTGTNLFDPDQPILSYGMLSSHVNLDVLAEPTVRKLRKRLGVERLHASHLGNEGLATIAEPIAQLQRKYNFRFDICRVAKPDHAIICFFDQVFDQGMNPAVTWTAYWTPLRYVLLTKLASLFDEELAREAWEARISVDNAHSDQLLVQICEELASRAPQLIPDARSRELLSDALNWASANPRAISYNVSSKKDVLQITPNVIGFQSVMMSVAKKVRLKKKQPSKITIDQQSQFNKAQRTLAEFYKSARNVPRLLSGPGLPVGPSLPTLGTSFDRRQPLRLRTIGAGTSLRGTCLAP